MDYYNDEVMENLIRAKNGLPFVHVDIASLSAVSGAKMSATVGGGQTLNNSGTNVSTKPAGQTTTTGGVTTQVTQALAGAAGFTTTIVRGALRPFTVQATPEQSDTLTILSYPVVGTAATRRICDYYTTFVLMKAPDGKPSVAIATNPNSLVEDKDYVPDTLKKWRGQYYYVPFSFKESYARLCEDIFAEDRPKPAGFIQTSPFLIQD